MDKFEEAKKFLLDPLYRNLIYEYRDTIVDGILEDYRNTFILFSAMLGVTAMKSNAAATGLADLLQRLFKEHPEESEELIEKAKAFLDKNIKQDPDAREFGKSLVEQMNSWMPHTQVLLAETLSKSFGLAEESAAELRQMFEEKGFDNL